MQLQDVSVGKVINLTVPHVSEFLTTASLIIVENSRAVREQGIEPIIEKTEFGRIEKLEKFSHYFARQIGFEDESEVPELCKLVDEYLRKPGSKECDESIVEYLGDHKTLYAKLVDEFERCILSYFAFNWNQAPYVINQVLSGESPRKIELKKILLEATREQRFEKVTKNLKVTRVFSTLVEEMKAIKVDLQRKNHTNPATHNDRNPVLLLMGGGMGAGKSTVLKDILKESSWSDAASNAVVVEADAFKESDVIYRALNSRGHLHDMLPTAELVHKFSTDAASSLLVTALNEGRDVIVDGTLSWEPFVEQTIAMARNVHKHRYRMGVGYKVAEDGTIIENYWERVNEAEEEHQSQENHNGELRTRMPYRIELVGVVCDGYLAVVRGIRRAIMTGRAVRVNSQLKSHKRFANAFPKFCKLVDNARLYCTNVVGGPPELIWQKDEDHNLPLDPKNIKCLEMIDSVNAEADSIHEVYKDPSVIMRPGSIWNDILLSPSRSKDQKELKECILQIEKSIRKM